jgi:prepilin-type processing-associated H-X9-DG protein
MPTYQGGNAAGSVMSCPAQPIQRFGGKLGSDPDGTIEFSYGLNKGVSCRRKADGTWESFAGRTAKQWKMNQLKHPSRTLQLTDTNYEYDYIYGFYYTSSKFDIRHEKSINVLFTDGHSENIKYADFISGIPTNTNSKHVGDSLSDNILKYISWPDV